MLCIIRCRAFFVAAGRSGRKESKMIKPIKIKKNNSKKNSKPENTSDEIRILIDMDDMEPTPESAAQYDCDMSPEEILASEIVFSLAGKAAESFTNAVDGLNIILCHETHRKNDIIYATYKEVCSSAQSTTMTARRCSTSCS